VALFASPALKIHLGRAERLFHCHILPVTRKLVRKMHLVDRSRVLLARRWFLDSAEARDSLREKINSEWDAVLSEKPDAYALTMNAAYKRRPFLTSRGYVGLGPEHLLEGDVICILYGGTVPFILRPRGEEMGGYYVAGEAYVDGIMDGEYMDTNPKIEEFVLC
jgi:hypothetical protein